MMTPDDARQRRDDGADAMESLDQVACENLCREDGLYPTILGSALAATIAFVLATCLGYL